MIDALADELAAAPRLVDRQTFRGVADRVKQKSGQKGRRRCFIRFAWR